MNKNLFNIINSFYEENEITKIIIHDIKNKLQAIISGIEILYYEQPNNKRIQNLNKNAQELIDYLNVIKNYEDFLNKKETINLNNIIKDSIKYMEDYFKKHNTTIFYQTNKYEINILFNPMLLNDIFINLFVNSVESNASYIKIINQVTQNKCLTYIQDNGNPIQEPNKIFQKGYTTKKNHNGFGLYTIKKILNNFNCDIYLRDNKTFIIDFPLSNTSNIKK